MVLEKLSHELRAPLQTLLGHVDLLRSGTFGALSPEQEQAVQSIQDSAEKILGIANDVLAVAGHEVSIADVDVGELLEREAADARPAAEAKGLELSIDCPAGLVVRSDARKLARIVANLVSNAVKYTAQGRVILRAGAGFLEVEDTGAGIEASRQAAVFEEYVQLDPESEGIGLGLSIVAGLADVLGATVSLASTPGKGTTVRVELA